MLKTRAKTCARCCHSDHPARNFERGAGPCLQNADVTKPHYRGGCAALRKVFSSTGPGQGLRRLWHGVVVPGQALSVWLVGLACQVASAPASEWAAGCGDALASGCGGAHSATGLFR